MCFRRSELTRFETFHAAIGDECPCVKLLWETLEESCRERMKHCRSLKRKIHDAGACANLMNTDEDFLDIPDAMLNIIPEEKGRADEERQRKAPGIGVKTLAGAATEAGQPDAGVNPGDPLYDRVLTVLYGEQSAAEGNKK